MTSFKDIRKKLTGDKDNSPENKIQNEISKFELEEIRFLMNLISISDFKGKNVQLVYNVAFKLQNLLEEYINSTKDASIN